MKSDEGKRHDMVLASMGSVYKGIGETPHSQGPYESLPPPGSVRSGSVHLALLSPAHSPFHSYRTGPYFPHHSPPVRVSDRTERSEGRDGTRDPVTILVS